MRLRACLAVLLACLVLHAEAQSLEHLLGLLARGHGSRQELAPTTIECSEMTTKREYLLWAYMPYVQPEDIKLHFVGNVIRITASVATTRGILVAEQELAIPRFLDVSKASSSWRDHVLELRFPLRVPSAGEIPIEILPSDSSDKVDPPKAEGHMGHGKAEAAPAAGAPAVPAVRPSHHKNVPAQPKDAPKEGPNEVTHQRKVGKPVLAEAAQATLSKWIMDFAAKFW